MKLRLTVQDMEMKETGERYQGLFGTLTVKLPTKDGKDTVSQDVNFATTVAAVPGLDAIIENMVVEALSLKKLERDDLVDDFVITQPSRAERRAITRKAKKKKSHEN